MTILLRPIILALLTGIITLIIPKKVRFLRRFIVLVSSFFILYNSLWLFKLRPLEWVLKGNIFFNLDALSGFIFLVISLFAFVVILCSLGLDREKEYQSYYTCIFWSIAMVQAAVLTNNIVSFIIFLGVPGLTLYLMINQGGPEGLPAAKKALIMIGGGDFFLMVGLAILSKMTETFNMHEISVPISGPLSTISFLCILITALTRIGVLPFRPWVPDAAEKGSAIVTAFFPGLLNKFLGIYLLLRSCLYLYKLNKTMQILLLIIGAFTIITFVLSVIGKAIHPRAYKNFFDIYGQTAKGVFSVSGLLQKLHSGILWTYLAWVVFGLLALLVIFLEHLF